MATTRDVRYTIDDLFGTEDLYALEPTPAGDNAFTLGVSPNALTDGEMLGNTIVKDGYLQSSNYVAGTSGWQLTPTTADLNLTVSISDLTSGTLTSESITLAADGTGDAVIKAGKTDFDNTVSGFILGIDDSDSDTPKFYIGDATQYFNWTGSAVAVKGNFTIDTGSGIANLTDAGALAVLDDITLTYVTDAGTLAGLNAVTPSYAAISMAGWNFTGTFSATDLNTVAWTSGTLRTANGTSYSISAGNTGNMSAITYIYLDIDVSTTALQTTTTATTAVGANKILVATAENKTDEAFFQVFGGAGGFLVTADQVAANAIVANNINVTNLASISADIGSITTGNITLDTSGFIKGGQTTYDTGTGFFLGYSGGAYKFSIGDASGQKITWDGSELNIRGGSKISKIFTAGEAISAGEAVMIANGTEEQLFINQATGDATTENPTTTTWFAQSFTTGAETQKISRAVLNLTNSAGATVAWTVRLRSSLTGSDLASNTANQNIGTLDISFDFGSVSVSPSTTYYIVVSSSKTNSEPLWNAHSTSQYAGGSASTSTDSGSTWGAAGSAADFLFKVWSVETDSGKVYLATDDTGNYNSQFYTAFIGFAEEAITKDSTGSVVISGVVSGQSGLTPGTRYYLSSTPGAISSSAGGNTVKVGKAVSATELLLTNIW